MTGTTPGHGRLDRRERSAHVHEQLYARGIDRIEHDDELRRGHGDVHQLHGRRRDAQFTGRSVVPRDERSDDIQHDGEQLGPSDSDPGGNLSFAAGGVLTLTKGVLDGKGEYDHAGREPEHRERERAESQAVQRRADGRARDSQCERRAGKSGRDGDGQIVLNGTFAVSNAAAVVTVGTNTFTTGAMSVSAGGFTQDGVNATARDSVASLSVSGGNCAGTIRRREAAGDRGQLVGDGRDAQFQT